jgi:hypothetical protein
MTGCALAGRMRPSFGVSDVTWSSLGPRMPTSTHSRLISGSRLGAAGDTGREAGSPDGWIEIMRERYAFTARPPSAGWAASE